MLAARAPRRWATVEALDRTGLWGRLFPEWGAVREPAAPATSCTSGRVDRHLVENRFAGQSAFTHSRVTPRSAGAPAHSCTDIGKGRGGDHSVHRRGSRHPDRHPAWHVGRPTSRCCPRSCAYHLLLPENRDPGEICRTRRPLKRWSTRLTAIRSCWSCCRCSPRPTRWPPVQVLWGRLEGLPDRGPGAAGCRLVMAGEPLPHPESDRAAVSGFWPPTAGVHVDLTPVDAHVYKRHDDRPRPSRTAIPRRRACSRLNSLAGAFRIGQQPRRVVAINTFVVSPHFGHAARRRVAAPAVHPRARRRNSTSSDPSNGRDLEAGRNEHRKGPARSSPRCPSTRRPPPPRILWFEGTSPGGVRSLQIRSTDRTGLLARLSAVIERDGPRHRLGQGHHAGIVGRRRVRPRRACVHYRRLAPLTTRLPVEELEPADVRGAARARRPKPVCPEAS